MLVTIRTAVEADAATLNVMLQEFDLYLRSLEPNAPTEDELLARGERKDFSHTAKLSFGPAAFGSSFFAEMNKKSVGYLTYHHGVFSTDPVIFIADIFVRKTARGMGIGRALMAEVEAIAARQGAAYLVWTVWHENRSAIKFYESFGGKAYDEDFVMRKRLGQ